MAGSRRRKAKTRKPISVKAKRKKLTRAKLPEELAAKRPDVEKKLGVRPEWDIEKTGIENYEEIGFVSNPNIGFGRNSKADVLQERAADLEETREEVESDDDMKVTFGKMRSTGRAPPAPLTANQTQIVKRLIDAHGDDVQAMAKDQRLNPMLHTVAKLQHLLTSYRTYQAGECSFRVPSKRLW